MMPSSTDAYWTVFVLFILRLEGVYSLPVKVSPVIFTDLNATTLTLPCEYVLENPEDKCNIRWEKGTDVVIVKDTVGQIFVSDSYKNRALWGDGCSLILLYPGMNDTGRYTFTAFTPNDGNYLESAHTMVLINRAAKGSRETTTGAYPVPNASQSIDPSAVAAEDGYTSPAWVASVPVTAIAIIVLAAHVVLMCYTERRGLTDIKHRLLLGGVIAVFTFGIIAGTVGMALRSTVITIVGRYLVYLGIVCHIACAFWFIKTKAFVSRKSTGSLFDVSAEDKVTSTTDMDDVMHPLGEATLD